jgi:hypothetical protein
VSTPASVDVFSSHYQTVTVDDHERLLVIVVPVAGLGSCARLGSTMGMLVAVDADLDVIPRCVDVDLRVSVVRAPPCTRCGARLTGNYHAFSS